MLVSGFDKWQELVLARRSGSVNDMRKNHSETALWSTGQRDREQHRGRVVRNGGVCSDL